MSPFEEYLISIGYKRFKYIPRKGYEECNETNSFYSTMTPGGLDYRYLLNDHEIIYGLDERGKPPTIVWPNPFKQAKPLFEDNQIITPQDRIMRLIKEKTSEEIYKFITNENSIP